jgi:hypothetical protein
VSADHDPADGDGELTGHWAGDHTDTLAALLPVFALLDKSRDLPTAALVCKQWELAASHQQLWQSLSLQGVRPDDSLHRNLSRPTLAFTT